MKVKLNIKREEKTLSNVNWKMIAAFAFIFIFSLYWIIGSYNNASESVRKIKHFEEQTKNFQENVLKSAAIQKNAIDKQYINSGTLNLLNDKIQLFEKLSLKDSKLSDFFSGIESSVTGETFITKLVPFGNKSYLVEGSSVSADNITKFIDSLKKIKNFDKVELKQIAGESTAAQKNLKFKVAFSYECESSIAVEETAAAAK